MFPLNDSAPAAPREPTPPVRRAARVPGATSLAQLEPQLRQEELKRVIGGAPVLNIKINDPPAPPDRIFPLQYLVALSSREEEQER